MPHFVEVGSVAFDILADCGQLHAQTLILARQFVRLPGHYIRARYELIPARYRGAQDGQHRNCRDRYRRTPNKSPAKPCRTLRVAALGLGRKVNPVGTCTGQETVANLGVRQGTAQIRTHARTGRIREGQLVLYDMRVVPVRVATFRTLVKMPAQLPVLFGRELPDRCESAQFAEMFMVGHEQSLQPTRVRAEPWENRTTPSAPFPVRGNSGDARCQMNPRFS